MALREALVAHRGELARIVHEDMGKTLADADGEVGRGIESTEAATAVPHLIKGETLEGVAGGVDVEMVRQPVGVVAAITPFNFPAMIPLWFLPVRRRVREHVVLKPRARPAGERAHRGLVASVEEIPAGVVNLVHGAARSSTASATTPASTPCRSSAQPRAWRATCTRAPRATASACRRTAARRTRWS
jgi:malonate-semialdehyde dehydrogenase (acetylating)/methylmalonate-semialdehyde dehydrogenase